MTDYFTFERVQFFKLMDTDLKAQTTFNQSHAQSQSTTLPPSIVQRVLLKLDHPQPASTILGSSRLNRRDIHPKSQEPKPTIRELQLQSLLDQQNLALKSQIKGK